MRLNVVFDHDPEGAKVHPVGVVILRKRKGHPVIGPAKVFKTAITTTPKFGLGTGKDW